MEIIFEIIFGFLGELLLSVLGEVLIELGFEAVTEAPASKGGKKFFLGFLYAVAGLVLGALSLKLLPLMVLGNRSVAVLYFVLAPVVAGLALCAVSWIIHRGIDHRPFFQLSKFIDGVVFTLAFSLTRTIFG